MPKQDIKVKAWKPISEFYIKEIGGAPDTGAATFSEQSSNGLVITQGFVGFDVDFIISGKNFAYQQGFPVAGTIKKILVEIDGERAYRITSLKLDALDAYDLFFDAEPFEAFRILLRGDDEIVGSSGNDELFGFKGDDLLFGEDGRDKLDGGKGEDVLDGGEGKDVLNGRQDDDIFQFSTAPAASNVDTIKKFKPGDEIYLSPDVFSELGNRVGRGEFCKGSEAKDGGDHLIWDKDARTLYWDPDGTGGTPQTAIFETRNNADITHKDIEVGLLLA